MKNKIKCWFNFHNFKIDKVIKFDSPKMDSHYNIGEKMQISHCKFCGKLDTIILENPLDNK